MEHDDEIKLELAFLHEQLYTIDRRATRLENALESSADPLEKQGLEHTLHSVQLERSILDELMEHKSGSGVVSLDALLMQHGNRFQQEVARLAGNWHQGQPIPPDYWEAETKRAFFVDLLQRYHTWRTEHPTYTSDLERHEVRPRKAKSAHKQAPGQGFGHPWYLPVAEEANAETAQARPGTAATNEALLTLRDEILEALRKENYPENHLEITVQPDGQVMVTGFAHSAEQHELAIQTIMNVTGISEVLADIKVVDPAACPACQPGLAPTGTSSGTSPNGNRSAPTTP